MWILRKTNAGLVISSIWRLGRTTEELSQILYNYGVPSKYVIGQTPWLPEKHRGAEIQKWLSETDLKIESFVILDDNSDMDHLIGDLVQTNPDYGLTYVEALTCWEKLTGRKGIELLKGI